MSSASTAETFSNAAIVEAGTETTAKGNTELTAQRTRVADIEAKAKSNEPPKSVVNGSSSERHIQPILTGQTDVMKMNGGGERKKPGDPITPPDIDPANLAATTENRVIYEALAEQVDRNAHNLAYAQALGEMKAKGLVVKVTDAIDPTVMAAMNKRGIAITAADYENWRKAAIADARNSLSAEAYKDVDPADVDQWIQDVYINSSEYRTTIASEMEAQYKALNAIPKREIDPAYEAAKAASKTAEKQRNDGTKIVADRLRSEIPGGLPAAIDAKLTDLVNKGTSTDEILRQLQSELIADASFSLTDISDFKAFLKVQAIYADSYDKSLSNPGSMAAKKAVVDAKKQLDAWQKDFTTRGLTPGFEKYSKILQLTNSQRTQTGYNPNSLGEELGKAVKAQGEFKTANDTIKDNEAARTESDNRWRAERNRLVSEATSRMDVITNKALDAVWTARAAAFVRANETASLKTQEEAKKAGETRLEEEIKMLQRMQEAHGVRRDEKTRQIVVNYEELGKDVRFLSYHTEDGIQRLMLSDLIDSGKQFFQTGPDGKPLLDKAGKQIKFNWETDDLSLLSKEDTEALNKLMDKHGDTYTKKLLGDHALAKGFGGLHGKDGQHNPFANSRHLKLKDHELTAIADKFGSELEAAASKTKEGKEAVDEAKKKGAKGKGLLMIILAILVGGVQGAKDKVSFS